MHFRNSFFLYLSAKVIRQQCQLFFLLFDSTKKHAQRWRPIQNQLKLTPEYLFQLKNNFVLISKRVKTFAHFNSFLSLSSFIFVRRHSRTRRTVMTSLLNFPPTQQFAASRTNKNTRTHKIASHSYEDDDGKNKKNSKWKRTTVCSCGGGLYEGSLVLWSSARPTFFCVECVEYVHVYWGSLNHVKRLCVFSLLYVFCLFFIISLIPLVRFSPRTKHQSPPKKRRRTNKIKWKWNVKKQPEQKWAPEFKIRRFGTETSFSVRLDDDDDPRHTRHGTLPTGTGNAIFFFPSSNPCPLFLSFSH